MGSGDLLERGLPIQACAELGGTLHQRIEQMMDEDPGPIDAMGEETRPDQRFHTVGENRGLVVATGGDLTAPQMDQRTDTEVTGDPGECAGIDYGRAQLRQLTLAEIGVNGVEVLGDHHAEDRIAEKLQPFVGRQAAIFVRVRAVGSGKLKELGVQWDPQLNAQLLDPDRGGLVQDSMT